MVGLTEPGKKNHAPRKKFSEIGLVVEICDKYPAIGGIECSKLVFSVDSFFLEGKIS